MSKNIILQEYDGNNTYKALYPKTKASQTILSDETAQLLELTDDNNVESAIEDIMWKFQTLNFLTIKVTDADGNPIEGVIVRGFKSEQATDYKGYASGLWQSDPMTIISPYVDILGTTVNGADYAGTQNILEVTLDSIDDNTEKQYTSSTVIRFSTRVKSVDVCCVGGGGGGIGSTPDSLIYKFGTGGGGGGIVNALSITPPYNIDIPIVVGTGGRALTSWPQDESAREQGGTSKFGEQVIANGGYSGYGYRKNTTVSYMYYIYGGEPGATNCGNGGGKDIHYGTDSSVSKFNEGKIKYSGGGGAAAENYHDPDTSIPADNDGGSPNGANGGYVYVSILESGSTRYTVYDATTPGIGGGGGGGGSNYSSYIPNASAGGNGIVCIRIHLT